MINGNLLLQILKALNPRPDEYITIVQDPKHSRYFFGDIQDLAGKRLKVVDRAADGCGDCLCIAEKGLVDIHVKDIVK